MTTADPIALTASHAQATYYAQLNASIYIQYADAFHNYAAASDGRPEPTAPMLYQFDEAKGVSVFVDWNNSFGAHGGTTQPDWASCITMIQSYSLRIPTPPPNPGPVIGPIMTGVGVVAGSHYTVAGDTSPVGTKTIGPDGLTYVKVGVQTPWGVFGTHWEPSPTN